MPETLQQSGLHNEKLVSLGIIVAQLRLPPPLIPFNITQHYGIEGFKGPQLVPHYAESR